MVAGLTPECDEYLPGVRIEGEEKSCKREPVELPDTNLQSAFKRQKKEADCMDEGLNFSFANPVEQQKQLFED